MLSTMVAKASDGNTQPSDQAWQPISLPDNLNLRGENYNGGLWYRVKFHWDCRSPTGALQPAAIGISYISMAGAVYLNNELLWEDTHLTEPLSRSWNKPRYWVIPYNVLKDHENELTVYVVAVDGQSPGLGRVQIDLPNHVIASQEGLWWKNRGIFYVNIAVSLTLAIIALFIWSIQRQEGAFGWFAISNIAWSVFISNTITLETYPFPNTQTLAHFNLAMMGLYIFSFMMYNLRYLDLKYPRVEKACVVVFLLSQAILWLTPRAWFQVMTLGTFFLYGLLYVVSMLALTILASRSTKAENMVSALILIFYLALVIHDSFAMINDPKHVDLWFGFAIPVTIFFFSLLLAWRLSRNIKTIKRFNQDLEQKVQEVTQQLTSSLNNEHQLALDNMRLQERIQLSHDLHDGLGGSLVRAITTIDQANDEVSKQKVLSILKLLRDDLRQIIDSGSSIASKAPETPQSWIAPTRYRFMLIFDELNIDSTWVVPSEWRYQPQAMQAMTLARVLEESLTNVIKHSKATVVEVVLIYSTNDELMLLVTDNGVGFNVESVRHSGMSVGMRSMEARVEKLGGQISIQSIPGKTVLQVVIPVK